MTPFREAQDAFQNDGVLMNAQDYLNAAIEGWESGELGDDSFGEAKRELRVWCQDTQSVLTDPRTRQQWPMD